MIFNAEIIISLLLILLHVKNNETISPGLQTTADIRAMQSMVRKWISATI